MLPPSATTDWGVQAVHAAAMRPPSGSAEAEAHDARLGIRAIDAGHLHEVGTTVAVHVSGRGVPHP
jgi:hypothetical protein